MDALGIRSALIDEFWTREQDGRRHFPGFHLPNGALRATPAQAQHVSNQYPDRFSYLVRVDFRDPQIDAVMRGVAEAPHARAVRMVLNTPEAVQALVAGDCRRCFAAAADHGVPVFVITHGESPQLQPTLKAFPGLRIILDHIGMARQPGQFEDVLTLAAYPNVALKWCHAEVSFGASRYPFPEVEKPLRRAIAAFGAERIMWASDFTIRQSEFNWADRLFYIRNSPTLTAEEKSWILGRTARRLLDWPAPDVAWRRFSSVGRDFTGVAPGSGSTTPAQ